MHHFLFVIETARQEDVYTPKHIVWPCLIKHYHKLCFGVNKFSYSGISMKKSGSKTGRVLGWCIYWFTVLPVTPKAGSSMCIDKKNKKTWT